MDRFDEAYGEVCGKLTAVAPLGYAGNSQNMRWLFQCECLGFTTKPLNYVRRRAANGFVVCCGCEVLSNRVEHGKRLGASLVRHGKTKTSTYCVWSCMHGRCTNPRVRSYKNYGGRGIKVCDRWKLFENFLEDMGERPDGLSIERVDNNGDYTPTNCRWATQVEQANNKRTTRRLKYGEEEHPLSVWADRTGVAYGTLHYRLQRGWPVERVLKELEERK